MTAHTDGPWQYDDHYVICQETGDVIAEVWTSDMEANGKLMAAAPDLVRALREIVSQIDQGGEDGKVFARDYCIVSARAAIAKATAP